MIADDNGVVVTVGRADNFEANTHYTLHPEAVDSNRGPVNVFSERIDAARLKTFMGYELKGR